MVMKKNLVVSLYTLPNVIIATLVGINTEVLQYEISISLVIGLGQTLGHSVTNDQYLEKLL